MDLTIAHRILGVNSFSSQDEVKNAYKVLVKKWHPDRHIDDKIKYTYAEENIKKIIEAYKYLLNHNSWSSRNEKNNSSKKKKINKKSINFLFSFINYIIIVFQYTIILLGLPFIIFWYHPIHQDLFPHLHKVILDEEFNFDKNNITLSFKDFNIIKDINNDSLESIKQIQLNDFINLLNRNNKSGQIYYVDLDGNDVEELIIKISSTIDSEYYHSIILFSYNNNNFNLIEIFENGTILDFSNNIFITPLFTFDSFYFCDSCYFSSKIINNKDIRYISPKVKFQFKNDKIYYNTIDHDVNKKIINNLKSLKELDFKFSNDVFDQGFRRLYAENILSYFYNNFDLNQTRDLFYNNYKFQDKHQIWKEIVVELIEEYSIIEDIK